MINFSTNKEYEEYKKQIGNEKGKYYGEMVEVEGKRKYMAVTDMAYDDIIWVHMEEMLEELREAGVDVSSTDTGDLREYVTNYIAETNKLEFDDIFDEY